MNQPTPNGWLDVHGHFRLPQSQEDAERSLHSARQANFMLDKPLPPWDPQEVIAYNDSAGVQMQLLSNIPFDLKSLQNSNDYGSQLVERYPSRFGLLAALPTDNTQACLDEIHRTSQFPTPPDGFAVTTVMNGHSLGGSHLHLVWEELNRRSAVVHIHPNAYMAPVDDRPVPLIEATFETARTTVDMIYKGVFSQFPNIKFILAHCGGALPALSGRLALLGTETWVPNPRSISRKDVEDQFKGLYVDTAAAVKTGLAPAVAMCGISHCIYGSDCGVPCSTRRTMNENKTDLVEFEAENNVTSSVIGRNGWSLFESAQRRVQEY